MSIAEGSCVAIKSAERRGAEIESIRDLAFVSSREESVRGFAPAAVHGLMAGPHHFENVFGGAHPRAPCACWRSFAAKLSSALTS